MVNVGSGVVENTANLLVVNTTPRVAEHGAGHRAMDTALGSEVHTSIPPLANDTTRPTGPATGPSMPVPLGAIGLLRTSTLLPQG
ncbi:hypothetical protein GUJ93_ZPchr0001g31478 [Zizania palustris]|uniref:Uncharacterized protein n=1 Tax=Zizania palustris TaxID=103762 RepID=A0A8J5REE9_ZIZPA|nr:hypothetical protein GUJ93_ZPchr0001g31478 [Zizania palustris]